MFLSNYLNLIETRIRFNVFCDIIRGNVKRNTWAATYLFNYKMCNYAY